MAYYLAVEKKLAQRKIGELKAGGLLDADFPVMQKEGKVWIAVRKGTGGAVELDAEPRGKKPKSLGEALRGVLSGEECDEVVHSFDIIGDIAIVEIPENIVAKEKKVAQAVMDVHRNVRVVAKKEGPMEGVYRVRKMKVIGGENRTETLHRESGAGMMLDVSKVYFSPRLSFERKRIAGLVKDGESILALFAGVGPFPLVIAKTKKKCNIVAIELNPVAAEYLKKNIALNKMKNIIAVEGDVGKIVPRDYENFADRVLMPLPKDAEEFLDAAYAGAKDGAIVHFYCFADIKNPIEAAKIKLFSK
ncbi:MAG: class I SAM-dependent methyltransferase family protein, partial [Candidatus ainarchaeum sp.]|nr:class I SAM-dependent methyltransferase family protein [Candidatus ainarchaeum sp.]